MAELTIQVRDNSANPLAFQDGDILHAMNDVHLLWHNTQILCDHRKIGGGFFKPLTSIAYYNLHAFSKYKIERISLTEIRVTNLITSDEEIKSDIPNPQGNVCFVEEYIERRIAGGQKAMFGDEANAVWFEGSRDRTLARFQTLWNDYITPSTGLLPVDYRRRSYSTSHLKGYLVIVTNDFNNTRRGLLEEPLMDEIDPENPVMIARRKRYIDWRNLPGMDAPTIADILDHGTAVAIRRDLIQDEVSLVLTKELP